MVIRLNQRKTEVAGREVLAECRGQVAEQCAEIGVGRDGLRDREENARPLADRGRDQAGRANAMRRFECSGARLHGFCFGTWRKRGRRHHHNPITSIRFRFF